MSKKKKIIILSSILVVLLIAAVVYFCNTKKPTIEPNKTKELPKPEVTSGQRGELGIDKNINESNIDEYLNREDAVYRDMRMLEDPAIYESIGGDRFLSGYIKGFEVVPLPYIIPVDGLPSEVGETYKGTTLFYNDNGIYYPNYDESYEIIEELFPKDKVIFLMCGGGGYAGMMKKFLVTMGWDENKIYNIGGYWYYNGKNKVEVKKEVDGVVTYDFESVPYHEIDFSKLTKTYDYRAPGVEVTEVKLNTNNLELEEGFSFQLNAIVLPNEANNKELKWSSSNTKVATVTEDGKVKGIKEGSATITVTSSSGNKTATCTVNVKKIDYSKRIKLDDISKEAEEMDSFDFDKIWDDFYDTVYDKDGNLREKYATVDEEGYIVANDLYNEEYEKSEQKKKETSEKRAAILNKLLEDKKTFIIVMYTKECGERTYSAVEGAEKLLKKNKISYIYNGNDASNGDTMMDMTKLIDEEIYGSSVILIKDGELYATLDPDIMAISSDTELKTWFSKYIELK